MNPLFLTAMVEVALLAFTTDEKVRGAAPTHWMYFGIAAIGAAFAATLLL